MAAVPMDLTLDEESEDFDVMMKRLDEEDGLDQDYDGVSDSDDSCSDNGSAKKSRRDLKKTSEIIKSTDFWLEFERDGRKCRVQFQQKEIGETGKLPDDRRLRDEFGLDEEAIAEMKQSVAQQDTTPPTMDDLPPPPDWGQDEQDDDWPEPRGLPQLPALPGQPAGLPFRRPAPIVPVGNLPVC